MWKVLCLIVGLLLLLPVFAYGAVATQDSGIYTGEATTLNFGEGLTVEGDFSTKTIDADVRTLTVSLTSAEVKALRATPQEIIPAPTGGDHIIEVIACKLILDYHNVSAFTETGDNLVLVYNDGIDNVWAGDWFEMTDFITRTCDMMNTWTQTCMSLDTVCSVINKNIALKNVGDSEIGGNAENDNTINVYITYRIIKGGIDNCTLGY